MEAVREQQELARLRCGIKQALVLRGTWSLRLERNFLDLPQIFRKRAANELAH